MSCMAGYLTSCVLISWVQAQGDQPVLVGHKATVVILVLQVGAQSLCCGHHVLNALC